MATNKYVSAVYNNPNEKSFAEPARSNPSASTPTTKNKYVSAVYHPDTYKPAPEPVAASSPSLMAAMEANKTKAKAPVVKPAMDFDTIDRRVNRQSEHNNTLMDTATKRNVFDTAADTVGRGAGWFNQGVVNTGDFLANILPRVEGAIMGVDPEATFTAQLLKPATKATGAVKDYVDETVADIDSRIQNDVKDNKAAKIATDLGSDVVAWIPQAVLAIMSGGASEAARLPAQATGVSGTVVNAASKMLNKPSFKRSFIQNLGNGYEEAKAQGASDSDAIMSTLLSSFTIASIEAGGGIDELPNALREADLTNPQKAWKWFKSVLEETGEGGMQEIATSSIQKGVYDHDRPVFSTTDENAVINPKRMAENAAQEAAVAAILGGGQMLTQSGLDAVNEMRKPKQPTTPDVDSVMPQVQQENKNAPVINDQGVENVEAEPVTAAMPQEPVENVAEHRDTAAQILDEGIFDSQTYGEALEQTGMKRSDVRQALRKIAQNRPGADADAEVRAVVNAIVSAEAQPQTQATVEPEVVETAPEVPAAEAQRTVEAEQPEIAEANPAIGAADYGFSPYSNYQNTQSQFIPEGASAARPVDVPTTDPTGKKTRRFVSNAMGAKDVPERGVEQMQNEFMEGRYGYEVKGDKKAVRKANQLVNSNSFDYAKAQTIERLQAMKNLKQTVVDAEVLIAKAYKEGRDADAAELCLLLAESGTEFGQAVQAFSIFRKLTPEGQIEGLRRTVDRLNEKIADKGGKRKTISDATKAQALEAMEAVREDALQMLENIGDTPETVAPAETSAKTAKEAAVGDVLPKKPKAKKKGEKDHGLEVENWMTEVGNQLAETLSRQPKAPKPKTVSATVKQDLLRFAKDYLPKNKNKAPKRTAVDTLTDFLANREQYVEAWNAAKKAYKESNPDDYDGFAGATMTYSGSGSDPVMTQAIVEAAAAEHLKQRNIDIRTVLGDQSGLEKQIADNLIKQTGATDADAAMIRDAVKRYFTENKLDINLNDVAKDLDRDIQKAVKQSGTTMAEVVRKNKNEKDIAAKVISGMLVNQYGISQDAAKTAANTLVDRFNNIVEQKSKQTLDSIFADPKKAEPKSAVQKVTELGNLGAFESDAHKGKAADKARQYVDTDIKKAVKAIGKDAAEIIRSSPADKAATAERIKKMLMEKHQLPEADAKKMGDFIVDRFNQMVAERSQKALENMFKERGKRVPKTIDQKFTELANLGAFTGEFSEAAFEKLFGEGVYVKQDLVDKFLAAPDEASRNDVMEEIYRDIGQQMPTTAGEIANQWRYTAMLLNPSTHIKNLAGNTTQLAEATMKDAIATLGEMGVDAASKLLRKGKGIDRTKAFLNLASEADRALLSQANADYANVRDEIQGTGKYKDTAEGKINEYRDIMKLNNPEGKVAKAVDATLRGVGKVSDFNSNLMDVEDTWFSQPRYAATLASYMKANGLTEITDEARAYAIKEAKKSTYRDANAISDFAKSMGHSRFKVWNGIINAIFPFKATPANVGVRAVEYSPIGLISTVAKAAKAAHSGEFKAANFVDDLSANITGSALTAVGIWLAQQGVLRAKGTGDEKEKEQAEREGYKQNSITVFGHSVPISALGAGSIPLLFGAAVYENYIANNPDDEGHTFDDFLDAFSGTLDPVMETTMLSGLQDALRSFQSYDPDAGIAKQFSMGAIDVAGNYVASFIPTLLSRIANSTDTAARQAYIDKNKDAQKLQGEVQAWQKKIPGLRNQMTAQIDAYGNEVAGGLPTEGTAAEKVAKAVANIVTPIYPSKIKTTEVDEEIKRLYQDSGLDSSEYTFFASDAPKSFEVKGETVYLTGKQYEQFAKTRNSSIQQIRSDVMHSEMYDSLPDDVRGRAMDKAYQYANALAKASLDVGYQLPDKWMQELVGASPEVVAQTILERSVENAANSNEYENKYLGLSDMLSEQSIDDQLALSLMSKSANEAYANICKGAGISVQQFLDAYGKASAGGTTASERKQAALDYIDTLGLDSKTASKLALGVHTAIGTVYSAETKLPADYLLGIGATEQYVGQMSKTQREDYDKYIKGSGVNLEVYQSAWDFSNSEESKGEKDADGKDIKGKTHRDKVVDYIDGLKCSDKDKGTIFLALGYSKKNMPNRWK